MGRHVERASAKGARRLHAACAVCAAIAQASPGRTQLLRWKRAGELLAEAGSASDSCAVLPAPCTRFGAALLCVFLTCVRTLNERGVMSLKLWGRVSALPVSCALLAGCEDEGRAGSRSAERAPLEDRIGALRDDLALGSRGDGVRAVQEHLKTYGYFPNDRLAARFPAWRPAVGSAPAEGVYDAATADAVRQYQTNSVRHR